MQSINPLAFHGDSAELDRSLGFQVHTIEGQLLERAKGLQPLGNHHTWGALIHRGNQSWVGLDPETLQTPYSELSDICLALNLRPGMKVIDLGTGYGRLAIVLGSLHPGVHFEGYELVSERVKEGQRIFRQLDLQNALIYEQDLTDENYSLPEADVYFLYDYGKVSHIRQTLHQLGDLVLKRNFKLIARGKGIRSLIEWEFPWLTVHGPIHAENYSIYSTVIWDA
jgi:hypothetical protein